MTRHRTAMVERMRRAEPAPDGEEAAGAVALAREALRQWRINMFFVLAGLAIGCGMVAEEPAVLRVMGVVLLVACVGFGV